MTAEIVNIYEVRQRREDARRAAASTIIGSALSDISHNEYSSLPSSVVVLNHEDRVAALEGAP